MTDRLIADGWFDVERTARISPETLAALNGHKRIEVSTGLHIEILNQQGHDARGRYYTGVVRIKTPDHLAILGYEPGACSLQDGWLQRGGLCMISQKKINEYAQSLAAFRRDLYVDVSGSVPTVGRV